MAGDPKPGETDAEMAARLQAMENGAAAASASSIPAVTPSYVYTSSTLASTQSQPVTLPNGQRAVLIEGVNVAPSAHGAFGAPMAVAVAAPGDGLPGQPVAGARGMEHVGGMQNGVDGIRLARAAKLVKAFAFIDMVFTTLFALRAIWLLALVLLPLSGYFGAKQLKLSYLYFYVGFLILQIVGRVVSLYATDHIWERLLYVVGILISAYVIMLIVRIHKLMKSLPAAVVGAVRPVIYHGLC